jgi:hypothetical protein
MNKQKRFLMEMLERVDQFGKRPELTLSVIITALFAVVTAKLTAMRDWVAGQLNGNGDLREGAAARQALRKEIYAMLRDIREVAIGLELSGTTGVSEQFRLPRPATCANTLAAARSFVTNATAITAALTARGLPATFIADLQAKITAFDAASGNKNDGKADQVGSTAALAAAGADGLKAVQELRTMMRLELKNNPELLAAWKSAARVEKPAPTPKAPETGGSGPTPTPPPPSGS